MPKPQTFVPTVPTIGTVMTAFPYFIEPDAHVAAAQTMLTQFNVHHLPVRDGDKIVGVITAQDLRRAQALGCDLSTDSDLRVASVCTREVHVVAPEVALDAVLAHMAQTHIDVVCVVKDGRLVGIYTFTDACRQFAERLRAQSAG